MFGSRFRHTRDGTRRRAERVVPPFVRRPSFYLELPNLLIDGTTDPYLDLAEAQDALTRVTDCVLQRDSTWDAVPVVTTPSNVLTIDTGTSLAVFSFSGASRVYASQDLDVTIAVTVGGGAGSDGRIIVYAADQTTIVDERDSDGVLVIPSAGFYWLKFTAGATPPGTPTSLQASFTVDGGASMKLGEARAAWDDGGETKYEYC